jgi:hypothetical protein
MKKIVKNSMVILVTVALISIPFGTSALAESTYGCGHIVCPACRNPCSCNGFRSIRCRSPLFRSGWERPSNLPETGQGSCQVYLL